MRAKRRPFEVCPRYAFHTARTYRRAMARLVAMMTAGASAAAVAAFIVRQPMGVHMRLSWAFEDASHPGTFAAAVFDILAN